MSKVSNERLEAILSDASSQIKELLHERADDIQRAWNENIEEAQADGKDGIPPLKIGASITVDLEQNEVASEVRFTATYKSKLVRLLPNPNQPEMNFDDPVSALTDSMEEGDSIQFGDGAKLEKQDGQLKPVANGEEGA